MNSHQLYFKYCTLYTIGRLAIMISYKCEQHTIIKVTIIHREPTRDPEIK